jgi:hypothetical protein
VTQTNAYGADSGLISNIRAGTNDAVAAFDYTFDTIGNLTYRSDNYSGMFERFLLRQPETVERLCGWDRDGGQAFPGHVVDDIEDTKATAVRQLGMDKIQRQARVWFGLHKDWVTGYERYGRTVYMGVSAHL